MTLLKATMMKGHKLQDQMRRMGDSWNPFSGIEGGLVHFGKAS